MRSAKVFIPVVILFLFNMDELLLMSTDNTPVGSTHQLQTYMGERESKERKLQQLKEQENHIQKIIKENQENQKNICFKKRGK